MNKYFLLKTLFIITLAFATVQTAQSQCTWEVLGAESVDKPIQVNSEYPSIAIDDDGVIFLAHTSSFYANVLRYDNNSWASVGDANFSMEEVRHLSMSLDKDG